MSVSVSMRVNGKAVSAELDERTLLVSFLRDELRLTGTHVGCDTSQCGACTVHVNGKAIKSCTMLAAQAEGAEVLTIEGIAEADGTLHPMQAAFKEHHGLQCGFCTPGVIMSALEFTGRHPNASEQEVRASLDGNLCRCTGYHNIVKAIMAGAKASHASQGKSQADAMLVGARVLRKEDYRFLTGAGQFTDDVALHAQAYAVFVRSPHAHANIRSMRTDQASKAPGVLGIYTGDDINAAGLGGLPCGWLITDVNGQPMREPAHPCLAQGKVRYVGDHVAVVIAETLDQARDAAALVEVDYEALEAVCDAARARANGAPVLHDITTDNTCFVWALGDKAAVDAGFAKAAHITELEFTNNRLIPNAIEPRAAVAQYSRPDDSYTLYVTNQNPHVERLLLASAVLKIPEHKLRVVAPDVGGAFGSKIFLYAEEAVVTWAAKQLNRPVRWTAERSESFLSDAHGRDHVTRARLALDKDGRFLALDVATTANMGAYLSTFASSVPTILYATLLAGQYATPAIHCEVTAVFTNTAPVDAYRGAGRPEATYVVERLVETAAREMGIDPAEIRRRNFITKFPHQTPVALQYDTGDYEATLKAALEAADVVSFEQRRKEALARGKLRGIGYSAYIEACGLAPSTVAGSLGARAGLYEAAEIRVHPTGSVTVFTGSHAHGQGHETTFAQVVADRLGMDMENVTIVHGDTSKVLFGMGTYGSRSIAVGGTAIVKALDKIVAKGKKIAAWLLEAGDSDVVFERGVYKVPGRNTQKTFTEIALAAYVPHNYPHDELEPGLNENAFYDPPNFTFPAGTYVCEVEIDPETGSTKVVSFTAVDDFGKVINPMIVEGQVHGGLTQGIGQALMEGCRYDESGQLVTGSFMDYCLPRASDVPFFHVDTRVTPCTHNPLGVKGCGEAGAIGAPAALMNAITNALGIKDLPMPATPQTVWRAASGQL